MVTYAASLPLRARAGSRGWISGPGLATGLAFAVLFWSPLSTVARDWWVDPDAGHGLLLAPIAMYLAWRRGISPAARPWPASGLLVLAAAVVLRCLAGVAAELYTQRISLLAAITGLIVYRYGARQLRHWWLPLILLWLSIPLPALILDSLAFPLQLRASRLGANLMEWRHVPVLLRGNVLQMPGRTLFVTEACSGLRSLESLLALGVLMGGLWLRRPLLRLFLAAGAVPTAVLLNGVRIFLTGFLTYFVDPALGEGVAHLGEGWLTFMVAFGVLGLTAWGLAALERWGDARA